MQVETRAASVPLNKYLAHTLTYAVLGGLYLLLPLLPLLASLVYQRRRYVLEYWTTLKKMVIHLQALSEGPVLHYFQDVAGRHSEVAVDMLGSCTQCGNCCLDKRCVFLEKVADDKYQCGVYTSAMRRFSNCGSFPISAQDIERYACPGYTVATESPIHWVRRAELPK